MKKKVEAEYQEWIKEQEAKLPEALKAHFQALVSDEQVGVDIFGGHLREADYHRKTNALYEQDKELGAKAAELERARQQIAYDAAQMKQWSDVNIPRAQQAHREAERLAKQVEQLAAKLKEYGLKDEAEQVVKEHNQTVNFDAKPDGRQEVLEQLLQRQTQMDVNQPLLMRDLMKVSRRSVKEGFDIDEDQLMEFSMKNRVDLVTAYEKLTEKPRLEKQEKEFEERLRKAREEGERTAISRLSSPDRLRPAGPLAADFATQSSNVITNQQDRISKAVEEFLSLPPQ